MSSSSSTSTSTTTTTTSSTSMSMRQTPLTCSGHTRPVVFLAFSDLNPDDVADYYCISACKDGKPMLRQGDTGDWIGTFEGHKGAVWGVDLNSNASKAATGAADFSAKVWSAANGEEDFTLQHKHIVKTVKFSSDSKYLATGSNDKLIRIFDLEQHESPLTTITGHTGSIKQVAYRDGDRQLISVSDDKTMRWWDVERSEQEVHKVTFDSSIGGIELASDGRTVTVAHGNKVSFFNADTYEKIREVEIPCIVYSASLLLDKKIFVCGGEDFKLYKFNSETGAPIENFKGHFGPVHCVRFSPDGELYASGSEDGTLRLWQTEVGKTYGLWKCVESVTSGEALANKAEVMSAS